VFPHLLPSTLLSIWLSQAVAVAVAKTQAKLSVVVVAALAECSQAHSH
jgi:hypothetical protein